MKSWIYALAPVLAVGIALPSSQTCKVLGRAIDNFDDPKYGAVGLSELNFLGPAPQGTYVSYTSMTVGSDAGLNNLPPPSGHNWVGTRQGGIAPNRGYDGFRIYEWKYACTAATLVQGVNVIPSCKFTIICNERKTGDAYRQSFFFEPDGTLGLKSAFKKGIFDSDFQKKDTAACSVIIDEAFKMVGGAKVPLDSSMVVVLFDGVVTSGVKCN